MAVSVVSANSGCYALEAQKPIVVAVLALEQPAAGALSVSSEDEWHGWKKHMLLDVNLDGPQ